MLLGHLALTRAGGRVSDAQLEARDYLVGYLVNTNLLSRVERLIVWGTQALSAGAADAAKDAHEDETEATGRDDSKHTHGGGEGVLRSEQKLLGYSVSLLQVAQTSLIREHSRANTPYPRAEVPYSRAN
jgi:hypothetical protein